MQKFFRCFRSSKSNRAQSIIEKTGDVLRDAVGFFVTFAVVVMLDLWLSRLVRHAFWLNVRSLRMLERSLLLVLERSALPVILYLCEHTVTAKLVAFCLVSAFAAVVGASASACLAALHKTVCNGWAQMDGKLCFAALYRHKVCFLS